MQPRGQCGAGVDAGRRAEPGRPGRVRARFLAALSLAVVFLVAFATLPPLQAQVPDPSDDAALSALTVNDGTNDLTLVPAFAPGTYVYAADVGNAVDEVTLTATVNDDGAEVSGVTLGGTAIADSDFTDGITVPSLIAGDNVIVVTVTAEDDATTQTYTVTVTRAAADLLVSNYLDNGPGIYLSGIGDSTGPTIISLVAQKFTTGFAAGCYFLDSVSFHADGFVATNISPQISIYSSGADGSPDSSLFVHAGGKSTGKTP